MWNFLPKKNDCSLFCTGAKTKKRGETLTIGRTYDGHLLDMAEFKVGAFEMMTKNVKLCSAKGSKALLIFDGEPFVNDGTWKVLREILLDFFRGETLNKIAPSSLDHVIVFTAKNKETLLFRHYLVGITNPADVNSVQLGTMGPSMDLTLGRTKLASEDLRRKALMKPQIMMKGKKRSKNITKNSLGEKVGRLHVKQDKLNKLIMRRFFKKGSNQKKDSTRQRK